MTTFSKRALLRASAAPAILGASLIATAAIAQDAPQAAEAAEGDTIIVTGSLIKNPNLARSTPVTATTADQIELKQNNTAEDILREIPGIVPSIGSAVNNGNGGSSFVNLRGLGENRNIVLLDGSRLVPAGLDGIFDLNNVPVALVERVDVLTGGASTTYGADAISGVVNFVLKSDFAGLEGNVSNQITDEGDGNYFRADVTMGANFDDGRGNVVFSIGYQARFSQAECDAAALATNPNDPAYRLVGAGGFVASDINGDGVLGTDDDGNVTEGYNPNPQATFNRRATELGPRVSDFVTTFFDYKLGFRGGITDSIDWDVSGSYGESEQIQTQKGYWLNSRVRQALLATSTTECLNTANGCVPLNAFGADGSINAAMNSFLNANSQVTTKSSLAQAKALINGDIGVASPFASDAIAFAIGGEYRKYQASQESDLLSQSGDLGGAGGAAPNITGGYDVYEAYGELVLPVVQDKPFFQDLTLEAGIRYSDYSVQGGTGYNTTTWKVGGSWAPVDAIKFRGGYNRAVRAPNIAELFAPLNTLLTNLAVDPCAGAAPVGNANLAAVCIAQGAPASAIGAITNDPAGQVNYTGGGNLALGPETSNSYTAGVVLQPSFIPGFSATADYYNIKIKGAITSPTPGDAIANCFGSLSAGSATSPACTVIRRNPVTGELFGEAATTPGLFLPLSNLGRLATDGVDFSVNYNRDIGFAKLGLSLIGNWTNSSKFQATPTSLNRECVGYYSVNCASIQPKWQFSQRTTLGFESFDVSLLWRYIDAVKFEPQQLADDIAAANATFAASGDCGDAAGADPDGCVVDPEFRKIKAEHYFDLTGRFMVSDNVTLTLTVQNMMNNKPKVVGNTLGSTSYNSGNVYPSTYDALGRRYAASVKFRF